MNLRFINKCVAIPGVHVDVMLKDQHPLVQNAVYMAKELLVLPDGQCNRSNLNELKKAGFYVSRLGIYTDKGIIVY